MSDSPESAAPSAAERAQSVAEQRRALPDQPGVYLFKDARGEVLYVGKAISIRKRVGGHFSGKSSRGGSEMTSQVATIDFLVTETEAEALLAEQQFIKRHRPRFNIRLRDDKSYPYIGISLDEEFPRVYFTRERHRSARALLRPLLVGQARARDARPARAGCFSTAPARGPSPGGAPACPASTTTSSAAGRPASATSTARSTGATSTRSSTSSRAATATSSATSSGRWPRRPAPRSSSAPRSSATGSRRCAR